MKKCTKEYLAFDFFCFVSTNAQTKEKLPRAEPRSTLREMLKKCRTATAKCRRSSAMKEAAHEAKNDRFLRKLKTVDGWNAERVQELERAVDRCYNMHDKIRFNYYDTFMKYCGEASDAVPDY